MSKNPRYLAAKAAADARWSAEHETRDALSLDWENCPIADGQAHLKRLLDEFQRGRSVLEQRTSRTPDGSPTFTCFKCHQTKRGRPASILTVNDPITKLAENIFLCSPICHERWWREDKGQLHGVPK